MRFNDNLFIILPEIKTAKLRYFTVISKLMRIVHLFFLLIIISTAKAQLTEDFSDGNFTENPVWSGITENFIVNTSYQLQSAAKVASTSWLFTPSFAIDNAVWEFRIMINYTTSSSNYASVYIISDVADITNGCNGYYVQIGGTPDEVSLFLQQGNSKTKIIDGTDKRVDGKPVDVIVRVERDNEGNFTLYSKLAGETEFYKEGSVKNDKVKTTKFFGLMYANSASTGGFYYFDDIKVTGDKAPDYEPPIWNSLTLLLPDRIALGFSEEVNVADATFELFPAVGDIQAAALSDDKTEILLTFNGSFSRGIIYTLAVMGISDLAGNKMDVQTRRVAITEKPLTGEVRWNEVMFENPENSHEYVEIVNTTSKVLDVSDLVFTTRKTDGTLNTGQKIPKGTLIPPYECMAFTEKPEQLKQYHSCPSQSNITATTWSALNNESATLVLLNALRDTVFDELSYSAKWHHPLVKNPKGVALEKIHPQLETQNADSWHSAGTDVNYGTPGYQNSQFRETADADNPPKMVWPDPEAFSPDNDGFDDLCFIRYETGISGYVANAIILSPVGEKVFHLAQNKLLSPDGYITWDGRTNRGDIASPGIYIIYFEIFNPLIGTKKAFKTPVVLTTR